MQFGVLPFLALLALVPLLALVLAFLLALRWRSLSRFVGSGPRSFISPGYSRLRQILKAALLLLAIVALVIALARPQWGSQPLPVRREGADVLVVLDVSLSMQATDVSPSRLQRAKDELSQVLRLLQGDRVGLVLFAGNAFLRFPLTTDISVADRLIQAATPSDNLLVPGSALGNAITIATNELAQSEAQSKVIILVTDGEDHSSAPQSAARAAAEQGIIIYALGVGTETGSTIPISDVAGGGTGSKLDSLTGQPVVTKLNPSLLSELAEASNGRYWEVNNDSSAYSAVVDSISGLKRSQFAEAEHEQPLERFQPFLLVATVLLFAELLLPERRRLVRQAER